MPDREELDRKGTVAWFTGLSGAGKSTLVRATAAHLRHCGLGVGIVDGDELRRQRSAGLGFSRPDREENMRRACALAQELARECDYVLVALIAPYRAIRAEVAARLPRYREIFVNAPLAVCEARDPKGLYQRARAGQLQHFTGIDDPYEPPLHPDLECRTAEEAVEDSVQKVVQFLLSSRAVLAGGPGPERAVACTGHAAHSPWVLY